MRIKILIIITLLICVTLYSQGIPYNQEFQTSTFTENNQSITKIAALANGGFVLSWNRWDQAGAMWDMYARSYQSDASANGDEFRVNSYTENNQQGTNIAPLTDGGFVTCWNSWDQNGMGCDVYAKLFHANGSANGDEFRVNSYYFQNQMYTGFKSLSDEKFLLCWQSADQDEPGYGVYAQLYNADGSPFGGEFWVSTNSEGSLLGTYLTSLADGGFVICWVCKIRNGSDLSKNYNNIYARLYHADGSSAGEKFLINSYPIDYWDSCSIESLVNGGFVICWSIFDLDENIEKIFARQYQANGTPDGEEFRVNTNTSDHALFPIVKSLVGGGYVVLWTGDNGDGKYIYANQYNASGSTITGEFRVNTFTNAYYGAPVMASLADSGYVICWTSREQDESSSVLYIKRYHADGSAAGQEFRVNSPSNIPSTFDMITLVNSNIMVGWNGYSEEGSAIFAKIYLSEPVTHQLQDYQLKFPFNDNTLITKIPEFSWGKPGSTRICYPWEIEYDLYLSTDEDFSNPTIYPGLQDSSFTLPKADSLQAGQTYFWKVLAKNIAGDSLWSSNTNAFFVSHTATKVEEDQPLPAEYVLEQNYPNPFNPVTTVRYTLPQSGAAELSLYDVTGRRVKTLVQGMQPAGAHTVQIDGHDLASGVYLYTLKTGSFTQSKKMVLIK